MANDLIVTGTHVGTHIDAFSHTSRHGRVIGGGQADVPGQGGYLTAGADTIAPIVTRGILLDIAGARDLDLCPAGYEVTPADLQRACQRQRTSPGPGDVVLVRTGWGSLYESDPARYAGTDTGVPGAGRAAAAWIAEHRARAAGSDTIPFECVPAGPRTAMTVHTLLLNQAGVHLIEGLDLEQLSADAVYEFVFIASPLRLVGATGSPVRPLAIPLSPGPG